MLAQFAKSSIPIEEFVPIEGPPKEKAEAPRSVASVAAVLPYRPRLSSGQVTFWPSHPSAGPTCSQGRGLHDIFQLATDPRDPVFWKETLERRNLRTALRVAAMHTASKSSGMRTRTAPASISQEVTNRGPMFYQIHKGKRTEKSIAGALAAGAAAMPMVLGALEKGAGLLMKHRELVTAIGGTGLADAVERITINPGVGTLELLSKVASGFTQYVVHKLVAEYVPRSSASVDGEVMIAPDYDPNDDIDYSSMTRIEADKHIAAYTGSVAGNVWDKHKMVASPQAIMSTGERKLIRAGPVIGDKQNYDALSLLVKTEGIPADSEPVGKLYVDYEIEFMMPTLDSGGTTTKWTTLTANGEQLGLTSNNSLNLLADGGTGPGSELGWSFTNNPFELQLVDPPGSTYNGAILLPAGTYLINIVAVVSPNVITANTTNCLNRVMLGHVLVDVEGVSSPAEWAYERWTGAADVANVVTPYSFPARVGETVSVTYPLVMAEARFYVPRVYVECANIEPGFPQTTQDWNIVGPTAAGHRLMISPA